MSRARGILIVGGALLALWGLAQISPLRRADAPATTNAIPSSPALRASNEAETYRLIFALGNDETEVARDLNKDECESMKSDRSAIASALGVYSESFGIGSIVCLPESTFNL